MGKSLCEISGAPLPGLVGTGETSGSLGNTWQPLGTAEAYTGSPWDGTTWEPWDLETPGRTGESLNSIMKFSALLWVLVSLL